ncbi:MAG: hypothetical protein H0U65_03195 [Rubrobacter sp.]|nr:hypothetical protein [Rubrobacter sp.]
MRASTSTEFANVSDELKERRQWLLWKWETVGENKATKVPYQSNGRRASSTNPATWANFEDAGASFERGGFSGIGFAVTKDDPFTGIDLDDCVSLETGEIAPGAMELVRSFDSYAEKTPSSTGLRIWIQATKPTGECKKPGLEVYDRGRYFTVTGWHLAGTPETIEPRQKELEALIAEEFPKPEEPRRGERRPYDGTPGEKLDIEEFLASSGVLVLGETLDSTAEKVFKIVCPWVHEHTGGDRSGTRVGQYADGALFFRCEHSHCAGRGWAEFREEVDPRVPAMVKLCKARRVWGKPARRRSA